MCFETSYVVFKVGECSSLQRFGRVTNMVPKFVNFDFLGNLTLLCPWSICYHCFRSTQDNFFLLTKGETVSIPFIEFMVLFV